jgi:hypothetical protein
MAIFKKRIEALTGLSIAEIETTRNQDGEIVEEYTGDLDTNLLDTYLRDGISDASNKLILTDPKSVLALTRESSAQSANNTLDLDGADILYVMRAYNGQLAECSLIPPHMQTKVQDSASLHYTSSYHPSYTIINNLISVYPAPSSEETFKVYYINNTYNHVNRNGTEDYINWATSEDASEDDATGSLSYFPRHKIHLVLLYAGAKCLDYKLAEMHESIPSHTSTDWAFVKTIIETEEDIELATGRHQSLTAEMQQYLTEYQWYMARSQALKQEYVTEFAMAGKDTGSKQPQKERA